MSVYSDIMTNRSLYLLTNATHTIGRASHSHLKIDRRREETIDLLHKATNHMQSRYTLSLTLTQQNKKSIQRCHCFIESE